MAPYPSSSSARLASRKKDLPSGYTSIDAVLAGNVPVGKFVSVMGLVKDYQVPVRTNGKDYKCTITIYDKSIELDDALGLAVSIFRNLKEIPKPTAGDVLVINSAKVQSYRDKISLITNRITSIHVYSASEIPKPPLSAVGALQPSHDKRTPGEKEHEYVSWLYHYIDKESVPDDATFQKQADQSSHTKDKFCTLEHVVDGKFCDVIVNVVKAPFDEMDKTTLWVSDYTENDGFHKFSWDGAKQLGERDEDSYNTDIRAATKWAGPFGRRSVQVTCFEPHASQVNSEVELGQWIRIRNLRIKFGGNGLNLEGVLHEDRDFSRRQIDILSWDGKDSREECDPRLKEAIRRKMDYEKLKKKQIKSLSTNESEESAGTKRRVEGSGGSKPSSKMRRKEARQVALNKVEEYDRRVEERLGLNDLIKCESQEQPLTPLTSIIEPVSWKTTVEGEQVTLTLPFACAKYRTNVRVVDFRPRKLENFAAWRKSTESDVLSDYSCDSDSESDDGHASLVRYSGEKIWEWRFALQLEDGDPKSKEKDRFWVVVDNIEAQQLTGMDACDLHEDPDALNALREQLFKLWGNLEEAKLQEQQHQITNRRRLALNQPPPSSPMNSDAESSRQGTSGAKNKNQGGIEISNKPFACCIRQYGVRVREPDPLRADAGEHHRWVRMFGLFGTKISG